jgi:lysozyme family protein
MNVRELIEKTLEYEGGELYTNDPNDAGRGTKYGISDARDGIKDDMADIDGDGKPDVKVSALTKDQAIDIYIREYFEKMALGLIKNPAVAWKIFDIGVNMGTGRAVRFVQQIVGEKEDGILGVKTANLVNAANPNDFLKELARKQILKYVSIVKEKPSQIEYLGGWIRRGMDY